MKAAFYILDNDLMQAVPTNEDWARGQDYEFYQDALTRAEELAVGNPEATYTIVRAFARVGVPKRRPPKVTLL